MPVAIRDLLRVYGEHLYESGYVLQKEHSDANGKKLRGMARRDWRRIYVELRGDRLYRWEAGNNHKLSDECIASIKAGKVTITDQRPIEMFPELDVATTEISWIGQHRCHENIQNLVVIEGIKGGDKTYWNFSDSSAWLTWRSQISTSRTHRRLILLQNLAGHVKTRDNDEMAASKLENLEMGWVGGRVLERCSVALKKHYVEIRCPQGAIETKSINGLYLRPDGSLEIFGCFRSGKLSPAKTHVLTLKMPEDKVFPALFIRRLTAYPMLNIFANTVLEAQQTDDLLRKLDLKDQLLPKENQARKLQQSFGQSVPDARRKPASGTPPAELGEVSRKYHGNLEAMFDAMLPILIEDSPFETVPVEFYYKALLNAWDAAGVQMVPSPQTIGAWMRDRSYRTVKDEDREAWIGFALRPVNYDLYRRRMSQANTPKIEEII